MLLVCKEPGTLFQQLLWFRAYTKYQWACNPSHHDYNNFFPPSFWQFHLPHIFDITETSVFHVEGATRDCKNYRAVKRRPSRYCSRWLDLGRMVPKNFRVTHGVGAVFVYAGILWGDVDVSDLLTFICVGLVIKQHHPSSTSKDGISRIELWYKIDFLDKILNFLWGLFLLLPLTFPDLNHFIPHLSECLTFVFRLLTQGFHRVAAWWKRHFLAVFMTTSAPVKQTAMKFIHSVLCGYQNHWHGMPQALQVSTSPHHYKHVQYVGCLIQADVPATSTILMQPLIDWLVPHAILLQVQQPQCPWKDVFYANICRMLAQSWHIFPWDETLTWTGIHLQI